MKRTLMLIAFAVLIVTLSISPHNLAGQASQPEAQNQPHMTAALDHLQQAQKELEAATHDKGGHRSRAVSLVKQAIGEVNRGIEFDNTHKTGNENEKPKAK